MLRLLAIVLLAGPAVGSAAADTPAQSARSKKTRGELDEIHRIFKTGPTVDAAKQAKYRKKLDASWDSTRVWLTTYQQRGASITIRGGAAETNDVTQLLMRLAISKYFSDVTITETERKHDRATNVDYYAFAVTMKAPLADPKTKIGIKE